MRQTVYIVDDDREFAEELASLLGALGHPVALFDCAKTFLAEARDLDDGCVLLDVRMPGLSGLQAQQQLITAGADVPIVFMTAYADIPIAVEAMRAGAIDFLQKPFREQALIDAVHDALARSAANRERRSRASDARARYNTLSAAERRVMALVASGLMNKQIAALIGRSEHTVKVHRSHVMHKMAATTVADLVRVSGELDAAWEGAGSH